MDHKALAQKIDHTVLSPGATEKDIVALCKEAKEHQFFSVCVNPARVALASRLLRGTGVAVCSVVGFPLGANTTAVKVAETRKALRDGAREIDVVMNVGLFRDGDYAAVLQELTAVRKAIGSRGILKVIVETALLDEAQKEQATRTVAASGAEFIKTSTGTIPGGGARADDLRLFRRVADQAGRRDLKIKAAGEIRTLETALEMLAAGADRLGASRSIAIVNALPSP